MYKNIKIYVSIWNTISFLQRKVSFFFFLIKLPEDDAQ